jgi:hypothetical protein
VESFDEKLARLKREQAEKDNARLYPKPATEPPPARTREQLYKDLKIQEETRRAIRDDVKSLSDREPVDPIREYASTLRKRLPYATPAERERIKGRLELLDAKIAEQEATKAEQQRQEDFNAHPLVVTARALVDGIHHPEVLYPDIAPEKWQRMKAISAASSEFVDPQHFANTVRDALSEIETEQLAADERKHREALAATGQQFSALNSAEAAAAASKARLEAAQKLGEPNGPSE